MARDLLAEARSAWLHKSYFLRGFPRRDHLDYDAAGRPLHPIHGGPWTLAEIQIDAVTAHGANLEVDGARMGLAYDPALHAFQPILLGEKMRLRIRLGRRPWDGSQLDALTDHLFLTAAQLPSVSPPLWRTFFRHKPIGPAPTAGGKPAPKANFPGAPVLLHSPDPLYTSAARKENIHGESILQVLISANGIAQNMRVIQPLGFGLDEAAAKAIARWRFRPAMRKGKPVATLADIDVTFRLFPPGSTRSARP